MRHIRQILFITLLALLFASPVRADVSLPGELLIIGEQAFLNDAGLTGELVIPEGVTEIGAQAFKGCTGLTSVVIPDSVVTIGAEAFSGCTSLTGELTIPESVTEIGAQAFKGCTGLTSVVIPDSVVTIGAEAFSGCTGLTGDLLLRYHVTVGEGCFDGVNGRVRQETHADYFAYEIVADSYVRITALNDAAYSGELIIPEFIEGYPVQELAGRLQSFGMFWNGWYYANVPCLIDAIHLPDTIRVIGDNAFENFYSVTSIDLPDGVTHIGSKAFYGCTSLTSVDLPGGLNSLSASVFQGCTALRSVTLHEGITTIGDYAFRGCTALASIALPEGTESIGQYAFADCSALTGVTFPDSLTSIGNQAFYKCASLDNVSLPDGVTHMGESAFEECASLKAIVIPGGVTHLSHGAFFLCSGLESVTIPESVQTIDSSVFAGCTSLESVVIPDSVTSMGGYVFSCCNRLSSVTLSNSLTAIGQCSFEKTGLVSIAIPASVTSIADHAFFQCASLNSVTFDGSVSEIGESAFEECTSLTGITIPAGVTSISDGLFYKCTSLSGVTIPGSVTAIGRSSFDGCTSLRSIVIPDSVKSIGCNAFDNCPALTAVRFPTTAVTLSAYAFARTGLTGKLWFFTGSVIDPNAFYGCVGLTYEIGVTEERTSWVFTWNGHKYQIFDEYRSWSDADAYCRSVGGHLLTITSAEEQAAVAHMLDQCGRNNYFIGGTDSGTEGIWRWTTGEEFSYTNWGSGSPDNFRGKEHCLTIWNIPSYGSDKHAWNDHTASGYYSDDEYDLWRSPDQVGFICEWGVDESAVKEIQASGSGLFWPILEIPYEFEISWNLRCDEIPNGGYNVYLFSEGESVPPFKLNSGYLTDTTYRGSSTVLQDVLDYYGYTLNAHIMVEYVDMGTGAVQYTAKTTGYDFKAIRPEDDAEMQYYAGMFKLGYQAVVLLHDIIHGGEYQIGDETYTGGMDRAFYVTCMVYKTATGKLDELDLLPTTRGALMAIAVMEDVAERKPREPVMNSEVKNVMAMAGFSLDLLEYAEEQISDESLLQYALACYEDISAEEFAEVRAAYHSALASFHKTETINGFFNAGQDALEVIDMVMAEYASYHSVTRSDVQPYIDAFRETGNESLRHAADCLEVMTAGDDSLITFLILLHGGQKVEARVAEWGYEGITKATLGPAWGLFVSGVDVAANAVFNAAEGFSAQILLMSLVDEIETIRKQFGVAYEELTTQPVTSYDDFMEKYYEPFVELKDTMLKMTKIELEKYTAVKRAAYDSFYVSVILDVSMDGESFRDRPAEEYITWVEGYIEPAVRDYYQIFIEPYSW